MQYFLFCSGNQHLLSVPVLVCLPSPWSSTPVSLLTFPWFQQYLTWIVFVHLCVFIALQHFPMLVHMDFDLALLIGFLSNPWLVCCVQTGLLCMFTCFSSVSSLRYPEKRCHNHPKPKWHLHTACFVQKEQQMFTFVKPEPSNASFYNNSYIYYKLFIRFLRKNVNLWRIYYRAIEYRDWEWYNYLSFVLSTLLE